MKQKLVIIATVLMLVFSAVPEAGAQWVQTSVPSSGRCFAAIGSIVFTGTGYGVFRSTNSGDGWQMLDTGLANTNVRALLARDSTLFAVTGNFDGTGNGFYRSVDSGNTWISMSNGFPNVTVNSIVISGTFMFVGTNSGVFRSSDSGNSWNAIDSGLPATDMNDTIVQCLLVDGTDLWAGGNNGIFLSTDNGTTWTVSRLTNGDPVQALAAMGLILFAGLNISGIFRSTNGGLTWTGTGWSGEHVQAFWVIGSYLFAATQEDAVILSRDSGANWRDVSGNLPRIDAFSLLVDGSNIYTGTGIGVSWIPLSQLLALASVQMPEKLELNMIAYPNPLTQSTTISFSSPESGAAEVTIVNLLGSEVKRIFSGELEAGEHSFSWDAIGMPPGMYECLVRSNGRVETLPISILR